ncbi:hypothetical protein BBJ28_00013203, partial [Nothophytophthora sp. Chile5]
QESTWIYLLHQQAPPQTRLSAEAALALPPVGSSSPHAASALLGGAYASSSSQQLASSRGGGASFPFAFASRDGEEFRPSLPSASSSMVFSTQSKGCWPPIRTKSEPCQVERVATGGLLEVLPQKRALPRFSDMSSRNSDYRPPPPQVAKELPSTPSPAPSPSPASSSSSKRNGFPKKCDFPMCKNSSRSRGFCYSHGGGRRCRVDGCANGAVSRDLCKRHGGGRRCRIAGCKSSSESGGLCYSHGGGRRCSLSWCSARAKKGGFCAVHLGGGDQTPPSVAGDAAVHPTVVETLLSLSKDQSGASSSTSSPSSGSEGDATTDSSTSAASTNSAYAIASLLN